MYFTTTIVIQVEAGEIVSVYEDEENCAVYDEDWLESNPSYWLTQEGRLAQDAIDEMIRSQGG